MPTYLQSANKHECIGKVALISWKPAVFGCREKDTITKTEHEKSSRIVSGN